MRNRKCLLVWASGKTEEVEFGLASREWIVYNRVPFRRTGLAITHSDNDLKELNIKEEDSPMCIIYEERPIHSYNYERQRILNQFGDFARLLENLPVL